MTLIQRDQFPTIGQAARAADALNLHVYHGQPGRDEYLATDKAIAEEAKALLYEEYAIDFPAALHERIYEKAYSDGHSSGWEEIESWYDTHVIYAREVLELFNTERFS